LAGSSECLWCIEIQHQQTTGQKFSPFKLNTTNMLPEGNILVVLYGMKGYNLIQLIDITPNINPY